MNIISKIGYYLQHVPLLCLVGYTVIKWRFVLGTTFGLFFVFLLLKNLTHLITDSAKLPKRALVPLMFFDLWIYLAKLGDFFCVDVYYLRAYLNLIRLAKVCPTTSVSVEKIENDAEVWVYTPQVVKSRACVVYIHGGGWCFLSARAFNPTMTWMAHYLETVVVSVEYRLAPEHPFPAPLIDCYNALGYVYKNQNALGVDADKVFVAGDSAGGNLSAALCMLQQDRKGKPLESDDEATIQPPLAGQLLLYPLLQCYNYQSGSMCYNSSYFPGTETTQKVVSKYILGNNKPLDGVGNPAQFEGVPKFWGVVNNIIVDNELKTFKSLEKATSQSISELGNSYIFPLHADDLTGLPPAYILVASADPLKDDGEWYAKYLEKFNVKVVLKESYDVHGFMMNYNQNSNAKDELMKIKSFMDEVVDAKLTSKMN